MIFVCNYPNLLKNIVYIFPKCPARRHDMLYCKHKVTDQNFWGRNIF